VNTGNRNAHWAEDGGGFRGVIIPGLRHPGKRDEYRRTAADLAARQWSAAHVPARLCPAALSYSIAAVPSFLHLINEHSGSDVLKHILCRLLTWPTTAMTKPPTKICPVITIAGQTYIVMTHMMAGLPQKELGKRVADLTADRAALRDAIDFLINGY
jgi:toxin CcdB